MRIFKSPRVGENRYLPHEQTTTGRERKPERAEKEKEWSQKRKSAAEKQMWMVTAPPADWWVPLQQAGVYDKPLGVTHSLSVSQMKT